MYLTDSVKVIYADDAVVYLQLIMNTDQRET